MKNYNILLLASAMISAPLCHAQSEESVTPADVIKPMSYCNPISALTMWADPTSVEYNGRLYVYGTNDQQEYDATGGSTNNSYGKIKSLVVMSTADMVNWTHHGIIDMEQVCGSWMWASWAPTIVSREEADGLTHFYMYFSNSGGGVGVITSTSPIGPWTAPLNHSLISGSTPGLGPCSCPFDPGVVIDDNGDAWLAFGGGDPVAGATKLQPGNARIVKLGDDMISLASDIMPIHAPYHFEANELNYIGGKYVYSYCTGWSNRNDWWKYSETAPAPSTCSICYMVSDDPLNPDSWQWGGEILANPGSFGYPWGNNHTHLHKYLGKYYMIYHTQVMENLCGVKGGYRSLAVNTAIVDEENVTIGAIKANNSGSAQIKDNRINPFELQQAETMWNASGVNVVYERYEGNTSISKITPGGWVAVRNVNFGDKEATKFTAKIRGRGRMEIRVQHLNSDPVGVLDFQNSTMKEVTIDLTKPISGVKTIFFLFDSANSMTRWDEWQFSNNGAGVSDIEAKAEIIREEYYTISGIRIENPQKGIYIVKKTYSDGHTETEKAAL